MIESTILLLQNKLQEHFTNTDPSANAIIDNIGMNNTEGQRMVDKIVITMINIEEETVLQQLLPTHDRIDHLLPIHFNLYLLITSNYPKDYQMALRKLDIVLQFFKGSREFSFNEKPQHSLQFKVELFTLNFMEIHSLWNSFGVKQLPSVMCKLKVTESIEDIANGERK